MTIPVTMQVDSIDEKIRLKAIGTINHVPGHWTSSLLHNAHSAYEYDDLDGVAYLKQLSESGFFGKSSGGVVYIRDDNYVVTRPRYGHGDNVEILNQLSEPVGVGTVEELFLNDLLMVKVLQVNLEEKHELLLGSHRDVSTVQQCLNQIVVWHSEFTRLVSSSPKARKLQKRTVDSVEDGSSTSSSIYDLELQRAKSRSRREAQSITARTI